MAALGEAVPNRREAPVRRLITGDPSGSDGAAESAISRRTIAIGLIVGIPVSALLFWLAVRGVDLHEVWLALQNANLWWFALAVPFVNMLFPLQALRWRHLVDASPKPGRAPFIALTFLGNAVSNVVPGRPGDIVRGIWLSRYADIPAARSLTSVGVDRAVDVMTVFAMLLCCIAFVPRPAWLMNLMLLGGVAFFLAVVVLTAAWWYASHSRSGLARAQMARADRGWLRHQVSGIVRGLNVLSRPRDCAWALIDSAIGWSLTTVGFWLVAVALGIHLDLAEIVFVVGVISLGSAIPSSPGMIGTYQWLSVTALGVVGVGQADALAYSILLQASWLIPVTLSGPFMAWWLTISKPRDGGAAERTAAAHVTRPL